MNHEKPRLTHRQRRALERQLSQVCAQRAQRRLRRNELRQRFFREFDSHWEYQTQR